MIPPKKMARLSRALPFWLSLLLVPALLLAAANKTCVTLAKADDSRGSKALAMETPSPNSPSTNSRRPAEAFTNCAHLERAC